MNRKILKSIMLCAVLALSVVLAGCVNPTSQDYRTDKGVTMAIFSDGEDYYAQFIVVVSVSDFTQSATELDDYFLAALKTGFEDTESHEDYPVEGSFGFEKTYTFLFYTKLPEDIWFLSSEMDVDYGFLNAKVNCNFENPFADAYKPDTQLGKVYNTLKNGRGALPDATEYFGEGFDLDSLPTKFLLNARSSTRAQTGNVAYDGSNYYYQLACPLSDTRTGGEGNRLQYTYKAMASYGWYTVALVLGLAAVGIILLVCKKGNGKTIDLNVKPDPFAYARVDIYDPFDLTGGSGGTNGLDKPNNPNGSNNSGGDIFDGF